jgi:hypothetical protein
MSSILALSVSDKIDQYGAYAGFASVLGLAVLSLLYFAQAREVKRLREWAGRSPERDAELQQRAVAAAQQRAIVAPARPATPVGAPAPAAGGAGSDSRPAAATPAGQAQGAPAVAPAAAAAATAAGAATATPGAPAAPNGPGGQPTTAMPAANGAAAPSTPAAGAAARPPVTPGQPLRVPGSAGIPPSSRPPEPEDDGRSRLAVFGAIGAIVVVAIVAVVLLTGVLGGDGTSTQKANTIGEPAGATSDSGATKTTTGKSATPTAAPAPGSFKVAVLNGTTVFGLARGVANRLQNTKFKIGNVTNAATQDRSATLVEFAPGHRAEADAVAKAIDVGKDSIQPLSPGSKTIAGDQAAVVVTVGADQNTSPQTQTTP